MGGAASYSSRAGPTSSATVAACSLIIHMISVQRRRPSRPINFRNSAAARVRQMPEQSRDKERLAPESHTDHTIPDNSLNQAPTQSVGQVVGQQQRCWSLSTNYCSQANLL